VPYSRIAWGIFEITGGRKFGYVYDYFKLLLGVDHFGNLDLATELEMAGDPKSLYDFGKWFNLMFAAIVRFFRTRSSKFSSNLF
jgi:hypothetical protein